MKELIDGHYEVEEATSDKYVSELNIKTFLIIVDPARVRFYILILVVIISRHLASLFAKRCELFLDLVSRHLKNQTI